MISIAIILITYDRYELLKQVLNSIEKEKEEYSLEVFIFDDASPLPQTYQESDNKYTFPIHYHRFSANHGKRNWYLLIDYILSSFRDRKKFDYYVFAPDDCIILPGSMAWMFRLWNSIHDPRKILLNLDNNRGAVKCWTNFQPRQYSSDLYLNNWVDMCFLCTNTFFRVMDFSLREKFNNHVMARNPMRSSGVGAFLSVYLFRKKWNMYLVKYSLLRHIGNSGSKMNPLVRGNQKLISHTRPTIQHENTPLVSIIIPVVKDRGYLQDAIRSILCQTYPKIEIILASDGNPNLKKIADEYQLKFSITDKLRSGQSKNINRALPLVTGKYIKILHDDDFLPVNSLYDLVRCMEKNNCDIVFGNWRTFKLDPSRRQWVCSGIQRPRAVSGITYQSLAVSNVIHGGTTMYRTEAIRAVKGYNEDIWTGEELELHLRLLKNQYKICYLNAVTTVYRIHPNQKSIGNKDPIYQKKREKHITAMRSKYKTA